MTNTSDTLSAIQANMQSFGLSVSRQVGLPDGTAADLFGSRTYFSWKGLVLWSQNLIVQDYADSTPTPADAQALFRAGFRHAKMVNRVPLLRGMQFGFMVVCCLVVPTANKALIAYAEARPKRHWALLEFPVVIDRSTGHVHYYRKTAMWGAFFFTDLRKLTSQCLVAWRSPPNKPLTGIPVGQTTVDVIGLGYTLRTRLK